MTTLTFLLYHRGELLTVRAELHDDALEEDGGGAAHVEEVLPTGATRRLGAQEAGLSGQKAWRLYPAEVKANEAAEEICRMSAYLRGRPWAEDKDKAPPFGWQWLPPITSDEQALTLMAEDWSHAQRSRYEQDHPTGPGDEATYREEAPYGSER